MHRQSLFTLLATFLVSFCLLIAAPEKAQAAADAQGWAGGLFGLTVPSLNGTSSRGIYGITAGAKVGSEFGLGVYYLSSQKNEDFGKFDLSLYGVQLTYHFEGEAAGVFFGGRVGTSKINLSGSSNSSPTNFGVVGGYDYLLGQHLSLGGEVSYMSVSKDKAVDSFSLLSFMAALKLWF